MNTLIRRENADPFAVMFDRFLNGAPFLAELAPAGRSEEGTLPLDISETDTHVVVKAAVPGFAKEDIDAQIHDNVLTLKAQHREEKEEKTERFYRKELRFGSMSRRVALPSAVKDNEVTAELKDGMLTLKLSKVAAQTPRKIKIG